MEEFDAVENVPLLCIPHAGGGASAYRRWTAALAPAVDVRILQLAGRESRFRERPSDDLATVVDDLCASVPAAPFALFGHSMGAVLAFEVAHTVRERTGREPLHLFVSACRAPHEPQVEHPLSHLPEQNMIAEIAQRYSGVPTPILQDAEYMACVAPAIRADFRILERYRIADRPPLRCAITAFFGVADPVIPRAAVAAWARHTSGSFALHPIDGEHFYLQEQRLRLAGTIRATLARDDRTEATYR